MILLQKSRIIFKKKATVYLFCSLHCFAAVQCPAVHELENGVINCRDNADMKFSYKNTCSFSCAPGYKLVGPSSVTCTSAAQWSEEIPHCEGEDAL